MKDIITGVAPGGGDLGDRFKILPTAHILGLPEETETVCAFRWDDGCVRAEPQEKGA